MNTLPFAIMLLVSTLLASHSALSSCTPVVSAWTPSLGNVVAYHKLYSWSSGYDEEGNCQQYSCNNIALTAPALPEGYSYEFTYAPSPGASFAGNPLGTKCLTPCTTYDPNSGSYICERHSESICCSPQSTISLSLSCDGYAWVSLTAYAPGEPAGKPYNGTSCDTNYPGTDGLQKWVDVCSVDAVAGEFKADLPLGIPVPLTFYGDSRLIVNGLGGGNIIKRDSNEQLYSYKIKVTDIDDEWGWSDAMIYCDDIGGYLTDYNSTDIECLPGQNFKLIVLGTGSENATATIYVNKSLVNDDSAISESDDFDISGAEQPRSGKFLKPIGVGLMVCGLSHYSLLN